MKRRSLGKKDLTGEKYAYFTVVSKIRPGRWLCACVCGKLVELQESRLFRGSRKSCGCMRIAALSKARTTHGKRGTRVYRIWQGMKNRCFRKATINYPRYGGRGITICPEWRESFEAFYADMGEPPSDMHSIHRIDNDGDYTPANCKWADLEEQNSHKSNTRRIVFRGESKTLSQWARHLGITVQALYRRLDWYEWPIERALTAPKGG